MGGNGILMRMSDARAVCDPYDWQDRTMLVAHEYVNSHYCDLMDGSVIDVEFILGESSAPKVSERLGG
jgi:hypothetical protein